MACRLTGRAGWVWGSAGPGFSKLPARGLRIKTDFIGFPGNRTQTGKTAGPGFSEFPARGLRVKTDFIGFPGNRTQTGAADGPRFSEFPARGLRTETDFIGFPGNRTQTGAAAGPGFQNCGPEVCVRKPISLGFRGIVRKPRRPPGRVWGSAGPGQMRSDA